MKIQTHYARLFKNFAREVWACKGNMTGKKVAENVAFRHKCIPHIHTYLLFFSFGHDGVHCAVSLPTGPASPLDESDYALGVIVVDDEVYLPYVQSLLPHTCRHQHVEVTRFELLYHLKKGETSS